MRLRFAVLAPLLLIVPAVALAVPGDMSVATYLAKADALRAKGVAAMMSSDIGVLRDEVRASGKAYRSMLAAEKVAGKPPSACPPAKMGIEPDRLFAHLRAYPAAQRPRITMMTAMGDWIKKTYPCRSPS